MSRILLLAALIAGISFFFVKDMPHGAVMIVWKGAGVSLLALWAWTLAENGKGRLLAAILGFGALGDMLLETSGLIVGALAFLIGHILAIALYLGEPRAGKSISVAAAIGSACIVSGAAFALTHNPGIAFYSFGLGAMAGSALASRFEPILVGLGAVSFVVSDLLIFAKLTLLSESPLPGLLIWPTYFAAQALIAIGVTRGLKLAQ